MKMAEESESDSMEFEQMSGIEYLKCILCSRGILGYVDQVSFTFFI